MKLTIEHLAPYLPYKIRVIDTIVGRSKVMNTGQGSSNHWVGIKTVLNYEGRIYKPILRPLSDLNKESFKETIIAFFESLEKDIKITKYDSGNSDENDFTLTVTYKWMGDVFTEILVNRGSVNDSRYYFVKWLLKNHFDVFGLIDQNLAIDINTLEP